MGETPPLQPPEGVPEEAWLKLAKRDGARWAIAERSANGEIIGTAYRFQNGEKGSKKGGKRGLIFVPAITSTMGCSPRFPIFVCEGASDTAALLGLGLDAVGIPMAGQCGEMLAELLKGREIAIVRDADTAGQTGADKVVQAVLSACDSVRVIDPPLGAKDAREAVLRGATQEDFFELAERSPQLLPTPSVLEPWSEANTWHSIADLPPATEPDWLWEGYLVRRAVTLLTGLWKGGKSTLLAHLLRDLYLGTGLATKVITGPVLLISEEPSDLWASRRDDLGLDRRIKLLKRTSLERCQWPQWRELIEEIAGMVHMTGAELVIFDTLPGVWPVAHENDAGEVCEALAILRNISQAGAAVLLVHHPRKGESNRHTSSRGSGALPGFADILIEFGRVPSEGDQGTRRQIKAIGRYAGVPMEQVFDFTEEGYVRLGAMPSVRRRDDSDTIAEMLAHSPVALSIEEIRKGWPPPGHIGENRLRELLNEGASAGRWLKVGSGNKRDPFRYQAMPPAQDSSHLSPHTREVGSKSLPFPQAQTRPADLESPPQLNGRTP